MQEVLQQVVADPGARPEAFPPKSIKLATLISGKAYRCVGLAYAMHHGAVQSLLTDEVATCSGVP